MVSCKMLLLFSKSFPVHARKTHSLLSELDRVWWLWSNLSVFTG